jgi:hypothetical protein
MPAYNEILIKIKENLSLNLESTEVQSQKINDSASNEVYVPAESKNKEEKEDSRESLHMEEEQYSEIDMGKNEDIKALVMEPIVEEDKVEDEEEQLDDSEPVVKKNDTLDSFIVNNDYFGEDDFQDKFDNSIDRITHIGPSQRSDVSYLMSTKNAEYSQFESDTIDNIMLGFESNNGLGKTSRPTKVDDINTVMNKMNYMIIKDAGKNGSTVENDSMNSHTMAKGSKAWKEWWKKKRIASEDLLMASESGDIEKIKDLLNKDITKEFSPNIEFQGLDDYTALHFAAQVGHKEICLLLIENKAPIEAKSSIGRTPLHLASLRDNHEVVKLLIENGADIN